MKISKIIYKIIYKIILLTMLTIICSSCVCHAAVKNQEIIGGGSSESEESTPDSDGADGESSSTGTGAVGLPSLGNEYRPKVDNSETITDKISSILSVLIILGVCAFVVVMALMGFGAILGSASEKAANQEKFVGLIIGALLLTGGSIIAKLIISVAESI